MRPVVDPKNQHSLRRDLTGIAIFVAIIWIVFLLDRFLPLEALGLIPRSLSGLTGIIAMPFLHADFKHLIGNTVPLAVTLFLLAGSRADSGIIVVMITLLAGVLLWLFGRTALHIGASALVFGLIAFHVFAGVFERRLTSIIIALGVGFFYSTTFLQGILPFQRGVSWEGHLFGGIAGAAVALITARALRKQLDQSSSPHDRTL